MTVHLSWFLAIGLHGFLLFGIVMPSTKNVVHQPPDKPKVEVELVEKRPAEEPPPIVSPPAQIEKPQELPPPEPEPEPEPPRVEPIVQPVNALPVKELVVAPSDAEFQVAATTNTILAKAPDVPLSPPVAIIPEVASIPTVINAQARYRWNPEPEYPLQAKRRRQQGLVLLQVILDTNGLPASVDVKESSGFTLLDNAAITAVKGWKFEPAKINDQTSMSEVEVPVRFKLK